MPQPAISACDRDELEERLRLALKIVEKSPVILFRRLAGDDPRLVYVSDNIRRIGYRAEDFLEERVHFADIVHHRDKERVRNEIEAYARGDVGDYTQVYRIVTRDGETRWVEDTTTTERDADGRIQFYQGIVVDITERKRSLILAGEVQKNLLPKHPPRVAGLDMAGRSLPCEEIGGDYFDFVMRRESSSAAGEILAVTVADIAGHGVDSALLMAAARTAIRERFASPGSLTQVVGDLNRTLLEDFSTTDRFMTLFALQVDRQAGGLRWVRAGHDQALVYYADEDRFDLLGGEGLPLGISDQGVFSENAVHNLLPGTVIALGTDGIWEARGPDGAMFGKARFREVIRREASRSAKDILDAVYRELDRFSSGYKQEDDITLVILKIEP